MFQPPLTIFYELYVCVIIYYLETNQKFAISEVMGSYHIFTCYINSLINLSKMLIAVWNFTKMTAVRTL